MEDVNIYSSAEEFYVNFFCVTEEFFIADRIKNSYNARLGTNFYFGRTYDKQEIDLIEFYVFY